MDDDFVDISPEALATVDRLLALCDDLDARLYSAAEIPSDFFVARLAPTDVDAA